MKIEKVIKQLSNLREYCSKMSAKEEKCFPGEKSCWDLDVEALTIAIEKLGDKV